MPVRIRDYHPDDAAGIAELWRASDAAWPGGLTGGAPVSAEKVREREGRETYEAFMVAEDDHQIVGYWKVKASPDRKALIGDFINVHPAYHGQGIGKAFQMKFLEIALARGFERMELGTWAGNLKAVPLYKRTGFFWVPETSVEMRSYLPQVLRLSGAQGFFGRHHWYDTYDRPIEVKPDDEQWEGVPAFRYRWHADGESIEVIADPRSDGLTAYEDSRVAIACVLGKEELTGGVAQRFEVRLHNKQTEPCAVTLFIEGDEGAPFSAVESFTLDDSKTLTYDITPNPEAAATPPGRRGYALTTRAVIGDQALLLRTGFTIQQPVDLDWALPMAPARPGATVERDLVVLNHLDEPLAGVVELPSPEAVHVSPPEAAVALPPHGRVSVRVSLRVDTPGGYVLRPRLRWQRSAAEVSTRRFPLSFHCSLPDRPTVSLDEERVILRNDWLHLENHHAGGRWERSGFRLADAVSGDAALFFPFPAAGPPFDDPENLPAPVVRVGADDRSAWAEFDIAGRSRPETRLVCRYTLGAEPFVRIDCTVLGAAPAEEVLVLQTLRRGWESAPGQRALWAPLREGVVSRRGSPIVDFPVGESDLPREPDAYAQRWFAWGDRRGTVLAWLFDDATECTPGRVTLRAPERPEATVARTRPLHLTLCPGDHRVIARLHERLYGSGAAPGPAPVFEVTTGVPVPATVTREWRFPLIVHNRREQPLDGSLAFTPPDGLQCDPPVMALAGVTRTAPHEAALQVEGTGAPGVVLLPASVTTPLFTEELELPMWRAGDAAHPVRITHDGDSHWLDSGRARVRVSPGFQASVTAFEVHGANHLESAYPTARAWGWRNPWFGGIGINLGDWGDWPLQHQAFTTEEVTRHGAQGIPWGGLCLSANLEHKSCRGLRIEVEYLLPPGGETLALVYRLINLTDGHWPVVAPIVECFPAVGGTIVGTRAHVEDDRLRHRAAGAFDAGYGLTSGWAVLENPATGHCLTLTTGDEDWKLLLFDGGAGFGIHGYAMRDVVRLAPRATHEMLVLFTPSADRDAALAARYLARLTALP